MSLDPQTRELANALLVAAREADLRLSTAESCTGGMVAAAITTPPGASDIFQAGFVTYANEAKINLLGVSPDSLANHGAVSEEVAHEMAQGAAECGGANIAVSITGIAGPGGSEFKPEGLVCFGLCINGRTRTERVEFGALGRDAVRQAACKHALNLLLDAAKKAKQPR